MQKMIVILLVEMTILMIVTSFIVQSVITHASTALLDSVQCLFVLSYVVECTPLPLVLAVTR